MKTLKRTISFIIAFSMVFGIFAATALAAEDASGDAAEDQTQNIQKVAADEDLPQGVPYRETNLPSFDEDATEDVRNLAPDEYVQSEEDFQEDGQLRSSMEDGSQAQAFANQIAGLQAANFDQRVYETQVWLNQNYGLGIPEDGKPGTVVSEGLVMAFQIELKKRYPEFPDPTGYFGDTTLAYCPTLSTSSPEEDAIFIEILQRGLFCKGYNPTAVTGVYGTGTTLAISVLKMDAGLIGASGSFAQPDIVKASLSSDAMKLVNGGSPKIREIQQYLNYHYENYIGIGPCDGYYSRDTNKALIYALQAEEGLDTSTANGTFGPTTKSLCPILSLGDSRISFVTIVQFALYCNGYNSGAFYGSLSESILMAAQSFERFVALPTRNTIDLDVWMALLTSTGNPNRDGTAADCSAIMTPSKVKALHNDGYSIVGRYLTGTVGGTTSKALTRSEMQTIFNEGLNLFLIYQDAHGQAVSLDYFTYEQGISDAKAAFNAADMLGAPNSAIIYFAIDYDMMDSQVTSYAIPYFEGIQNGMVQCNRAYQVGIYSARNTCAKVSNKGLACSSFVSDMSTGYSGNLGYSLPSNWAFDQVQEYTLGSSDGSFGVDKDVCSGRYTGFNSAVPSSDPNAEFFDELDLLFNLAMKYTGEDVQLSNELVCQVLRKEKYNDNDKKWYYTAGHINEDFYNFAMQTIYIDKLKTIYDPKENLSIGSDHLMATINAILYTTTNFEYWIDNVEDPNEANSTLNDFAGWAGDIVSVTKSVFELVISGTGYQDAADYYIGNRNGDGRCSYEDILQDIDAYNIGHIIKGHNITLPSVIRTYYSQNGTCNNRYHEFYNNMSKTDSEVQIDEAVYNRIMSCCTSNDVINLVVRSKILETYGFYDPYNPQLGSVLSAEGKAFYNLIVNGMNNE